MTKKSDEQIMQAVADIQAGRSTRAAAPQIVRAAANYADAPTSGRARCLLDYGVCANTISLLRGNRPEEVTPPRCSASWRRGDDERCVVDARCGEGSYDSDFTTDAEVDDVLSRG